jgi:P4 family phage/plasmid primase-like protien
MLKTAQNYLAKGWSIIPIKRGSKLPAISEWTTYQTRKPTLEEVTKWWTDMPEANIALICGKISGVIVVDIDSGKGEPDLTGLELPPTLSSKTGGGGKHFIYKWREGLIGAKIGIRKLVDIRSDNSYIVLPPSLHSSGNLYEWSMLGEDEPPAPAPKWLESDTKGKRPKTDWSVFFNGKKPEGTRNDSALVIAGKLFYQNTPDTWDTLGLITYKQWNKEYNQPPLEDKELMATWESVKALHIKGSSKLIKDQAIAEKSESTDDEEKEIVKVFIKNKTEGTYLIAKHIVNKYSIITVGEKEREMFVYQNGYYRPAENTVIFPEVQRILEHHVNKNAKLETFHKIADMTSHPRSIFTSTSTDFIPLKNGVYNYKTKELLPHDPKYRFTYQFPIIYDPNAVCPKSEAFMDQILTPEQRSTFEEWLGYYFLRNYMFKKAMIFVGEGDTGKTTLLEVITHLLGRDNLSSISLQKMSSDKFSAAHLYEKHGNLVDELSARDITDTGTFKVATGGGSITGEYKFGNQFSFLNFSKFTFACNRIPDVSSDANDDAYFNRWIITRFENRITKKIPNFIATLTTEEERSGLFNIAMKGLERLLEQGRFTYNYNAEETKTEMLRSGSSLAMFASERLERKDDEEISKEAMYEAYTAYCKEKNISSQTKDMLGKKFTDYAPYASDGLILDITGKKQIRGWRNVHIKTDGKADKEFDEAFNNKPF